MKFGFYKFINNDFINVKYADNKQISSSEYELQEDIYYRSKKGDLFLIKKGFIHDGASKGFLKRFGKYSLGALLHDALYASELLKKSEADNLFLEAMELLEVSYAQRYTYYWAVVLMGWNTWRKHTNLSIAQGRKYIKILKDEK